MLKKRFTLLVLTFATMPAAAQLGVSDNDLRTGLLDLNARMQASMPRLDALSTGIERLRQDNELLRNLLADIDKLATTAANKATARTDALQKVFNKINVAIEKVESERRRPLTQLQTIAVGADGQYYEQALTLYASGGQAAQAQAMLAEIIALKQLSNYTPAAKHWHGRIDYEQGDFVQARATLTELLKQHPNAPRAANTLHLLYDMAVLLDDEPEAGYWQRQILQLHPDSPAADVIRAAIAREDLTTRQTRTQ